MAHAIHSKVTNSYPKLTNENGQNEWYLSSPGHRILLTKFAGRHYGIASSAERLWLTTGMPGGEGELSLATVMWRLTELQLTPVYTSVTKQNWTPQLDQFSSVKQCERCFISVITGMLKTFLAQKCRVLAVNSNAALSAITSWPWQALRVCWCKPEFRQKHSLQNYDVNFTTLHGWNEDNPAESAVMKDNVSAFPWQRKQNKWNPCFTEKVFHNYHQSTALNDFGSASPPTNRGSNGNFFQKKEQCSDFYHVTLC